MPLPASVALPQAPLDSSCLKSVGYLVDAGTMDIVFRSGSIYRYFGVPPQIYQALLEASSKGRYFGAAIRSTFRSERLQ